MNRYKAIHIKDRPDTIIYDTKHEEPILSLPRFGYEAMLNAMNDNALSILEVLNIQKKIRQDKND